MRQWLCLGALVAALGAIPLGCEPNPNYRAVADPGPAWELVTANDFPSPSSTFRMKVPGGWLYRTTTWNHGEYRSTESFAPEALAK